MNRTNTSKKIGIFSFLILLLLALAFGYAGLGRLRPTKERLELVEKLKINGKDEYALCLNGEYVDERAVQKGKEIYLPLGFVKQNVNNRFYYNKTENHVLYSLPDETVTLSFERIDDEVYVRLSDVKENSEIGIRTSKLQTIGIITKEFMEESRIAFVKKDNFLREKGGVKSPVMFDVLQKEPVFVKENMEKWAKVFTVDGRLGYIQKDKLRFTDQSAEELEIAADMRKPDEVFENQVRKDKICLGWHLMMNRSGNSKLEQIVSESPAMNVISPTWFSVKDNEGNLESFADKSYVDRAHALGLEVWGLIGDINYKEAKAKVFLHHSHTRAKIIDKLIDIALEVGMDGINLDFESIPKDSGEDFIQFVRELSIECRENDLVLSIDNYVPKNFNRYFNRKEQGIFADYVVIMGYDEHYAGSNKAGSVASVDFVKNGIDETLREVPPERVINGVPAYMRVWTHTADGLKTKSISMHQARVLIKTYNLSPEFDQGLGQYYSEYTDENGNFCQIWFEDKESLDKKMDVMLDRGIAGVAIWRLGLETSDTWEVFERIHKNK